MLTLVNGPWNNGWVVLAVNSHRKEKPVNTWSPIFGKVVDSSLWMEEDVVVKVFLTMLAKKDSDHVVEASAFTIASWAKKTEAETLEALKVLSSPDTKRLEPQPYDGRRIERVEGGWLILNGQHYEDQMRLENRRSYQRRKQTEYRAKKRGLPVNGQPQAPRELQIRATRVSRADPGGSMPGQRSEGSREG